MIIGAVASCCSGGHEMLVLKIALMLTLVGGATEALSQAADNAPRSAEAALFRFGFHQPLTPQNRIELGRLSQAYCQDILDNVPTNTPAEDAWVATEARLASDDTNRLSRLLQSKEYARHQLKETMSECLQKVILLQQAQALNSRMGEAAQFISLAYAFNDDSYLAAYTKRVGMRSEHALSSAKALRQVLMVAALRALDGRTDAVLALPPKEQQTR